MMASLVNSTSYLKKNEYQYFLNLPIKSEGREQFQILMTPALSWPKQQKEPTRKEIYRPIYPVNTGVNILNKVFTNHTEHLLKRLYTVIKWHILMVCKNNSTYANQSMWCTILTEKGYKSKDYLNRGKKAFKNATSIYNEKITLTN